MSTTTTHAKQHGIVSWRTAFFLLLIACVVGGVFEARLIDRIESRFFKKTFPWQAANRELLEKMVRQATRDLSEPSRRDLLVPATGRKSNIEESVYRHFSPDPAYAMPYGCLAFGLSHANRRSPTNEVDLALRRIADALCDEEGNLKLHSPVLVEHGLAGWLLLELSQIDKEPRYLKAAGQLAKQYTKDYPKSAEGTLGYMRLYQEQLLVDSVGLLCPFLIRYGVTANDQAATDLGVLQLTKFIENGCDSKTGLAWHAYNTSKTGGYGAADWTRGSGWLQIGLAETITYLPADHAARSNLIAHWQKLSATLVAQQRENGLWGWALNIPTAAADTSATAMIAVSIQKGIELGILPADYSAAVQKAVQGIARRTNEDGTVTQALYDCQGVGHYPAAFGPSPFAQGFALAAISTALPRDR